MLEEVRISSLGVIDDAVLELSPGFNVVTGETGDSSSTASSMTPRLLILTSSSIVG